MKSMIALSLFLSIGLSQASLAEPASPQAAPIGMGNGEKNAIVIEGIVREDGQGTFSEVQTVGTRIATRRGDATTLTFAQVQIDGDGWLVLHPFVDGKPNGNIVSGYTFVPSGKNENVAVTLDHLASKGDRFIVMLHGDVDGDKVFDFVFVDDTNVEDKAVFEGNKIVAHPIAIP